MWVKKSVESTAKQANTLLGVLTDTEKEIAGGTVRRVKVTMEAAVGVEIGVSG